MSTLELSTGNSLFYIHHPPTDDHGRTFVFFNALTADTDMWEGSIGAALRGAGLGTLSFNFRGQRDSAFTPGTAITADVIVADATVLLKHTRPSRPIFVGLSIGGLFGALVHLGGSQEARAEGLVLINTLRRDGPRLKWINDALVRAAEVGGLELFKDLFMPMLFAEPWLAQNRSGFLQAETYQPLDRESGHYNLISHAGSADWDVPYEAIDVPVLVVSGLRDRVFLDLDTVRELAARMPKAERLDIAEAGHLIPAEAPDAISRALLNFADGT